METTNSVVITLAFADATTRNMKFNGVDADQIDYVADRVIAINEDMPTAFRTTFVSATGAQCTMISRVQWIETTEEVIYSAD